MTDRHLALADLAAAHGVPADRHRAYQTNLPRPAYAVAVAQSM
jgi:hypothetical protein